MQILIVARMFFSSRKFWATNKTKFLSRAVSSYFSLRSDWLSAGSELQPKTGLEISGWADTATLYRIKEALVSIPITRVFRPDVWYLFGGRGGLFMGFRFEVSIEDLALTSKILEQIDPALKITASAQKLVNPEAVRRSCLESIRPLRSANQKEINWYSSFSVSPSDFTWLVEATADKDVAEIVLSFFSKFDNFEFEHEIQTCIAKLCLVLDHKPEKINLKGWSLTNVASTPWKQLESAIPSITERPNSRVTSKYFQAENLVITNGGILVLQNEFLDWDFAQLPSLDFVAGNHALVIGSPANLHKCFVRDRPNGVVIESGITLSSRVDSNWFHFLIETLPRLFLVDDFVPPEVPVLVSSRVPQNGLEALALITKRRVQIVNETENTLIRKAYVPGPVVYHPDTQFLWNRQDEIEINVGALKKLRETVLSAIGSPTVLASKKIFWTRGGHQRVVLNTRHLVDFLTMRGFVLSDPATLRFSDQVKEVNQAGVLVTPGGATMSNFIFASSKTKIVVLVSRFGKTYPVPQLLSKVAGSSLVLVSGWAPLKLRAITVLEKSHASFRISIWKLKRALSK